VTTAAASPHPLQLLPGLVHYGWIAVPSARLRSLGSTGGPLEVPLAGLHPQPDARVSRRIGRRTLPSRLTGDLRNAVEHMQQSTSAEPSVFPSNSRQRPAA